MNSVSTWVTVAAAGETARAEVTGWEDGSILVTVAVCIPCIVAGLAKP